MIYNLSQPNTSLDSIPLVSNYTFTFDGLIFLFIIIIIITIIIVICAKRMIK